MDRLSHWSSRRDGTTSSYSSSCTSRLRALVDCSRMKRRSSAAAHLPLHRAECSCCNCQLAAWALISIRAIDLSGPADATAASVAELVGGVFHQRTWEICTRRAGKLYKARSRLYRSQILQVDIRWKAPDEIYKIYMLLHRSDLNISANVHRIVWRFQN